MRAISIPSFILSIAAMSSGAVRAESFCINDGTVLADTIRVAANNGQDDTIRLRTGVLHTTAYFNSDVTWDYKYGALDFDKSLALSGGWNSNCTSQTIDPSLTVLDAQNLNGAMQFREGVFNEFSSQLSLSNFTITRGLSAPGVGGAFRPAALSVALLGSAGSRVTVEHVVLTDHRQIPDCSGCEVARVSLSNAGILRFRNNIVQGNGLNTSLSKNTAIVVDTNAVAFVTNNSIFNNRTTSSSYAGLSVYGVATLSNNVLAQNTTTSPTAAVQLVSIQPENLALYNNHVTAVEYSPPNAQPSIEQGTTTGDPMWSGTGSIRVPNAGSPLLDSGRNGASGGLSTLDARGHARIQNAVVDRGAVEAQPPSNTGPIISALQPDAGSTTILAATAEPTRDTQIFFLTQSGNGTGQTAVDCYVTSGFGAVTVREFQIVSNGGIALPATVTMDNPISGDNVVGVRCDVYRENGVDSALHYTLIVRRPSDQIFQNGFD